MQKSFNPDNSCALQHLSITDLEICNTIIQIGFDIAILHFFGIKSAVYLFVGFALGLGIHPLAGHFISDHYVFTGGQETYSYYGPVNMVTFNVGCHVEHHDFPFVCGANLPKIRKIAPEFYDHLTIHTSWVRIFYDFITDPEMSLRSRIKRKMAPLSEQHFYGVGLFSTSHIYNFFQTMICRLYGAKITSKEH